MTLRCAKCRRDKAVDEFYVDARKSTGRQSYCKECQGVVVRDSFLLTRYGVTGEQYVALLEEQVGRCAICKALPERSRRLDVDHDHVSGVVRGLLCSACNKALGFFKDDPDALRNAISYLDTASASSAAYEGSE